MHFVSLGDSITYGEGASNPCRAYPSVLAQIMRRSMRRSETRGEVLAQPGWTSASLTNAVIQNGPETLSTSSHILIWIGGDDLAMGGLAALHSTRKKPVQTIEQSLTAYARHLGSLIRYVQKTSGATLLVCTQYNPFPNSAIAVQGIGALNTATEKVGRAMGVHVVPSATWFQGRQSELIAGFRSGTLRDAQRKPLPIHPNDAGHLVIAEGLAAHMAPSAHS